LQEHNQSLAADNYYRRRKAERRIEDVGEVVEERLQWMRKSIFDFWRGSEASTSTGSSSSSSSNSHRPDRVGPLMDAKWWFWNICFALLPAVCIAAYCEFIGRAQMLEANRHMHIEEQKRKWGNSYDPSKDEELARLTLRSEPFSTKLYNAIYDLASYTVSRIQSPADTNKKEELSLSSPPSEAKGKESAPPLTTQVTVKSSPFGMSELNEDAKLLAELKQKLETLEQRLQQQDQHKTVQQQSSSSKISPIRERAMAQRHQQALERDEVQKIKEMDKETCTDDDDGSVWKSLSQVAKMVQETFSQNFLATGTKDDCNSNDNTQQDGNAIHAEVLTESREIHDRPTTSLRKMVSEKRESSSIAENDEPPPKDDKKSWFGLF